jgi:hypothetical protein
MNIDISIDNESLAIDVENPYKFNIAPFMKSILDLGEKSAVDLIPLKIEKLIPRMIQGVAGCENGCPSNAKSLVRDGVDGFSMSYIEGGILSAVHNFKNGKSFSIKLFPDFD